MCLLSFSLALPIKSALFALALVLALSGLGLFLAKVALYNRTIDFPEFLQLMAGKQDEDYGL